MNEYLTINSKFSNTLYKILDTSFTLFAEKGYANVTVADIYKSAGVSRGAIRGYFEKKIELLDVLASEVLESINERVYSIVEDNSLDFQSKLARLLELSYQHPKHFNLIKQADSVLDPENKLVCFKNTLEESKTHLFLFFDENIQILQSTNKHLSAYSSKDIAALLFSYFESLYANSLPKVAPCSKETILKNIAFLLGTN